jgi:hypothetical protein
MFPRPLFHSRVPLPIVILALAILLCFFLVRIFGEDYPVKIPVRSSFSHARNIESFLAGTVNNDGTLVIEKPSFLYRLIAPDEQPVADPVYEAWFFGIILIGYLYLRKLSPEEPFTERTLKGMKALTMLTLIIFFIALGRQYWLYEEVAHITANKYVLRDRSMGQLPQLWILILLGRGVQIFRKGYQLTLDQQYTV